MKSRATNSPIITDNVSYANNALVNTATPKDHTVYASAPDDGLVVFTIYNPSTVTDLTVDFQIKETLNGAARYGTLTSVTATKNTTKSFLVQGWCVGEALRLNFTNTTVLGGADAFTAYYRVRIV
jgi:hypothetical protein